MAQHFQYMLITLICYEICTFFSLNVHSVTLQNKFKKINIIVWAIPSQGLILGGLQGDRCTFDKLVKFMLFMAVLSSTPFFLANSGSDLLGWAPAPGKKRRLHATPATSVLQSRSRWSLHFYCGSGAGADFFAGLSPRIRFFLMLLRLHLLGK